jgi:prepilin-type N-terminal cleavage/methylation domain-containing protein
MKEAMRHPRSDSGFALIEVIVSAAVLALVSLAVLAGIDGASASSAREKARAVAMSLAEADQERMRQLPVTDLADVADTPPYQLTDPAGPTRTIDGVTYTITSTAQWVRDDTGGSVSCTSDGHAADYFHITSTVTSSIAGSRIRAAKIDSVTAPNVAYGSTHGTLAVKITSPDGTGVQNVAVTVSGGTAPPGPQSTNALGCAVFEQVNATTSGTDYTVTLNTPGYVDHFGVQTVTRTTKVTAGKLQLLTIPYAPRPVPSMTANVYTYAPGSTVASPGAQVPSKAFQVSAVNSGDPAVLRNWPATTPASEAFSPSTAAQDLFPFPGAYTFFAGNCHYNDPTDQANYQNLNTDPPNIGLLTGQQQLANAASVSVTQPPLNIQVVANKSAVAPTAAMTVYAIPQAPTTDSCVQPRIPLTTVDVDSTATGYKWMVARSGPTNLDAGVPYGKYAICLKDGTGAGTRYWTSPTGWDNAYDNTTPPTGRPTTLTLPPAGTKATDWTTTPC